MTAKMETTTDINFSLMLWQSIFFVVILGVCLAGAYAREVLDTIADKEKEFNNKKVILSALVVSIVLWGFSETLIEKMGGFKQLIALSVFAGLVSYDLVVRSTKWEFIKDILAMLGLKLANTMRADNKAEDRADKAIDYDKYYETGNIDTIEIEDINITETEDYEEETIIENFEDFLEE